MLALMRCVLAFSALAIIYVDPSEPARLVGLTYASLIVYCIYSATVAFLSHQSDWPAPPRITHWIDVFFYVYLVGLTEGTSSIFFLFFFFAILVASFSRGFREGLSLTVVSVVLFVIVGLISAPTGAEFELNRTLIRPVYLLTLGYLIAYWGGHEILLKRRLSLLQEVNNVWNPRFGVDHTIGVNLDRLLEFYDATSCILVLRRPTTPPGYLMYGASRRQPGKAATPGEITEDTAGELLRLPETLAAAYHDPPDSIWRRHRGYLAYDLDTRLRVNALFDECKGLANLLDTRAFVTVPYAQRDGTTGRIYLTSGRGAFTQSDIDFLAQLSGTISPVVENMYLMEELTSRAVEHERLRISRDLHDTTIQPYIGLKLALDALSREAGTDGRLSRQIGELIDMTNLTIRDLRTYAAALKDKTPMPGEFLISAVKKQAQRLGRFYGIEVEVKSDLSAHLSGRLAAEAFQMISEGLSNILRHTSAKRASVIVLCENSELLLKIGNETGAAPGGTDDFTPRSIHERARALGGTTFVERSPDGYTVVHVTIPM